MNFQTILEELDRLYEAKEKNHEVQVEETEVDEGLSPNPAKALSALTSSFDAKETEALEEDADTEVEEAEVEEAEDEAQLVVECANCGGINIISEADIVVDEATDLANIEDVCKYCEEAKGYKILGALSAYGEVEEPDDDADTDEETIEIVDDEASEEINDVVEEEEELEELFNLVDVKLDARGFGGTGNNVDVV